MAVIIDNETGMKQKSYENQFQLVNQTINPPTDRPTV